MRGWVGAIAALAVLWFATPAAAQQGAGWEKCTGRPGVDWDVQIADCTRLLGVYKQNPRGRFVALINRGLALNGKGELDRAIADFSEAAKIDPKDAAPLLHRGTAWYTRKDYDRAIADYSAALRIDPKSATAHHNRSAAWRGKGDLDKALADANRAIALDSKQGGFYDNRCTIRTLLGRELEHALGDCADSVRLQPGDADARARAGHLLLKVGELDTALGYYRLALNRNPKSAMALYGRGVARLRQGDAGGEADLAAAKALKADVVEEFAKYGIAIAAPAAASAPAAAAAPALTPATAAASTPVATSAPAAAAAAAPGPAASEKDRRDCSSLSGDAVIAACGRVIAATGETPGTRANAFNNRGLALVQKGDFDRAIADYGEAIRLKSDDAFFHNRGLAWEAKFKSVPSFVDETFPEGRRNSEERKKALDNAISDYTEAIRLDPKADDSYHNRGQVWAFRRDYDRAMADYDAAIRINPRSIVTYLERGLTWMVKRDYDRAIADFTETIKLNPNFVKGYYHRAELWTARGNHDGAIADYSQAIRVIPDFAGAFHLRGLARARKGDYERAVADLSEAIRLDPKDELYLRNRCWVRATAGRDLQAALADCNKSLELLTIRFSQFRKMDLGFRKVDRALVYLQLGQLDAALVDYDEALENLLTPPVKANALFGRGIARLRKGDATAGQADIAAAKEIQADIAEEFAKYGIRPVVASAPARAADPAADCAMAETHWKSADSIGTVAVYEDHLKRFPACAFATLAKIKLEALSKRRD